MYRPRTRPLAADVLVGCVPIFIVLAIVMAALLGCDPGPRAGEGDGRGDLRITDEQAPASGPTLLASSSCDGACNLPLCENVAADRDEHTLAGRWAFVDCLDTMLACITDPDVIPWCGTCEHDLAECMTIARETIEECDAEWTNDTCAQGWDTWCHLMIAAGDGDCEAECNAGSLACLEDPDTCGGDCIGDAVECRSGCT